MAKSKKPLPEFLYNARAKAIAKKHGGKTDPPVKNTLWKQPGTNLLFSEPDKVTKEGTFSKNAETNSYSVFKNNSWYPTTETTALGESKRTGQSIQTFKKGGAIMRKKSKTPQYDFGGYATAIGSGALAGASTGAAFGPWGAAIGGAIGGISGAIGESNSEKADEKALAEEARMTQQASFYQQPAYFKHGGMIEVEGGELKARNGMFEEFKGPSHAGGGIKYTPKPGTGDVIISKIGGQSGMYKKSGNRDRMWSETTHVLNQMNREKKEMMKYGGIPKYKEGAKVKPITLEEQKFQRDNPYSIDPMDQANSWEQLSPTYSGLKPEIYGEDPTSLDLSVRTDTTPQKPYSFGKGIDLGISGPTGSPTSGTPTGMDWQKGLNTAATLAAPIYNTAMGIFGKANVEKPNYNPYEKRSMDLLQNRVDPSFGLRKIGLAGKNQRRAMSGLGSQSQGSLLSNFAQSGANEMEAGANYIDNVNKQNSVLDQGESAGWKHFGQERVGAENYAAGLTRQNKVNQAQHLPKGITQWGQIGRENMNIPMYKDIYGKKISMQKEQQFNELVKYYMKRDPSTATEKAKKDLETIYTDENDIMSIFQD